MKYHIILVSLIIGFQTISAVPARAESRFISIDPKRIIKEEGLAKYILEMNAKRIVFRCGGSAIEDYTCILDISAGILIDRIPIQKVSLPEKERERFAGKDIVENIYYLCGVGCDASVSSMARTISAGKFEYEYYFKNKGNRPVHTKGLETTEFTSIIEPPNAIFGKIGDDIETPPIDRLFEGSRDVTLIKMTTGTDQDSNNKASRERKQQMVFGMISFPGLRTLEGKGFRGTSMGISKKRPQLFSGESSGYIFSSGAPPGRILAYIDCGVMPGSPMRPVPYWTDITGKIVGAFMDSPMQAHVVGPRKDLVALSPKQRIEKMAEEVKQFGDIGWMKKSASVKYYNIMKRLANDMPATEVGKLCKVLNELSQMSEKECSVECRNVLDVNIRIAIDGIVSENNNKE